MHFRWYLFIDKNPHPDAKNAFDALQDAYDTLSSPSKRADYDKERNKLANSRKLTWKRLQRKTKDWYRNTISIIQLSLAQHKKGETMEIVTNIKECLNSKWQEIEHYWEHFTLLPSLNDKLAFLGETIKKKRVYLGVVMILLLVKGMNYPDLKVLFSL